MSRLDISDVLGQLGEYRETPRHSDGSRRYSAKCPAHQDHHASLSINSKDDGRVLFYCEVGCDWESIVACFTGVTAPSPSVETQPASKKRPTRRVCDYIYATPDGEPIYKVVRMECHDHQSGDPKSFPQYHYKDGRWHSGKGGVDRIFFNLPDLHARSEIDVLYFVEGEKDVERLRSLGHAATCCCQGAGQDFEDQHAAHLRELSPKRVVIIADRDDAGLKYAARFSWVCERLDIPFSVERGKVQALKSDVSDHLDAGYDLDQLESYDLEKLAADYPPPDTPTEVTGISATTYQLSPNAGMETEARDYFVDRADDQLIWVPGMAEEWHTLEGGVYRPGEWAAADLVGQVATQRVNDANHAGMTGRQISPLRRLCSASGIRNVMWLSRSQLRVPLQDLGEHRYPDLLPVENGIVDLRTGDLLPHDPKKRFTLQVPLDYDPNAKCPKFLAFIEEVQTDPEIRLWLHRLLGNSCTGRMEQLIVCFWGKGANGKSALLEAIQNVLGGDHGFAAASKPESWMDRGKQARGEGHRADMVRLRGRRLVLSTETNAGGMLDEAAVKSWTGGEMQVDRGLFRNAEPWQPQGTLVFSTNNPMRIRDGSEGTWRRIRFVPWTFVVPPKKRIPQLGAKLFEEEGQGILRWLVTGAIAYYAEGLADIPRAIREATADYQFLEDDLGQFLDEMTDRTDRSAMISVSDLHLLYKEWAEAQGLRVLSKTKLSRDLKARGVESGVSPSGSARVWFGVRAKSEWDN